MDRLITSTRGHTFAFSRHHVLRNTYLLLGMTLAFSAVVSFISMLLRVSAPHPFAIFAGFYGLLYLTHRWENDSRGILAVFALTGFLGYSLALPLNHLWHIGAGDLIATALGGTALIFFSCSAYVLTTQKEMSFLAGFLNASVVALLVAVVASLFLRLPIFHLGLSVLFMIFSSGIILLETSRIIHGGENNYIRATVTLYTALYNIFVSLLQILIATRDRN